MSNGKVTKDYNWMILFFLLVMSIIRLLMHLFDFEFVDIFIAIINLVGLDYAITSIINSIYKNIEEIIDNSDIVTQAKKNKKKRHKSFLSFCLGVIVLYNIFHLLLLSCSVANDMLSMIVLGISLTDNSIISFFVRHSKI